MRRDPRIVACCEERPPAAAINKAEPAVVRRELTPAWKLASNSLAPFNSVSAREAHQAAPPGAGTTFALRQVVGSVRMRFLGIRPGRKRRRQDQGSDAAAWLLALGVVYMGRLLARMFLRRTPPPTADAIVLPAENISQETERLWKEHAAALEELRRRTHELQRTRAQWRRAGRRARMARAAHACLGVARWVRVRSPQWLGTRAAGACLFVGGLFLIALVLTSSLIAAAASLPLALGLACVLWYWPSDRRLAEVLETWQRSVAEGIARRDGLAPQLRLAEEQQRQVADRCHQLRATLQAYQRTREYQAARLLERGWRHLRGYEFEQFLAEAFRLHGHAVTCLGGSGDQGVDLIVQDHGLKVAVQAKGYEHAVSNAAVQQAYAGQRIHGCAACMVITNSRFTQSAREAALAVGCGLVDGHSLPALVLGRRRLRDFLPEHPAPTGDAATGPTA